MEQLVLARRQVIRGVADRHFLIEGVPCSLPALRTDLEHALGCRVAIYLADQMAPETWRRIEGETVPV